MTKKELRNLIVAVVLAVAGAAGTAYWTISGQVGDLRERVSHLEGRLEGVNMELKVTVAKATALEGDLGKAHTRVAALEGDLTKAQAQVVALEKRALDGDKTIRWVASAIDPKALKPDARPDWDKILEEFHKIHGGKGPIGVPRGPGK